MYDVLLESLGCACVFSCPPPDVPSANPFLIFKGLRMPATFTRTVWDDDVGLLKRFRATRYQEKSDVGAKKTPHGNVWEILANAEKIWHCDRARQNRRNKQRADQEKTRCLLCRPVPLLTLLRRAETKVQVVWTGLDHVHWLNGRTDGQVLGGIVAPLFYIPHVSPPYWNGVFF